MNEWRKPYNQFPCVCHLQRWLLLSKLCWWEFHSHGSRCARDVTVTGEHAIPRLVLMAPLLVALNSVHATQAQDWVCRREGCMSVPAWWLWVFASADYSTMHTRKCIPIAEPCSLLIDTQQTYGQWSGGDQQSQPQPFSNQTESAPSTDPSQMAYSSYPDGVHHGAVPEGQTDAPGHYMQQQEYGSGEQHQQEQAED